MQFVVSKVGVTAVVKQPGMLDLEDLVMRMFR